MMQEFEIKKISELIKPSLYKIKTMSKSFSFAEFYKLEKRLAVISITPKQIVISYAPTFINDDCTNFDYSNQEFSHFVTHHELSAMIKKKIYEAKDISEKNDPRIEIHCYTNKNCCFCHPHFRKSNNVQQNTENLIITQSMIDVIQSINNRLHSMESEIEFYALEKYGKIKPYPSKKIEDLNLAPENYIGITHAEFIQMLKHERERKQFTSEDFER